MSEEKLPPICIEIIKSFCGSKKNIKYYIEAVSRTAYNENLGIKPEYDQKDLATIGDSVLDLLVAERLFQEGTKTKGGITKEREEIVKDDNLKIIAEKIELQEIILWGSDEEEREVWKRGSTAFATSMEAIFGGLFLAKGYNTTKKLFNKIFI